MWPSRTQWLKGERQNKIIKNTMTMNLSIGSRPTITLQLGAWIKNTMTMNLSIGSRPTITWQLGAWMPP